MAELVAVAIGMGLPVLPVRAFDDVVPSKKINRHVRPASHWNGGALRNRSGSGSAGMPADQASVSGSGLYSGGRQGRYWAADPLYHAHHAGDRSAAERAQTIAEGPPAIGGELPGQQSTIWAAALTGNVCATGTGGLVICRTSSS